jgi:hypothetical protein
MWTELTGEQIGRERMRFFERLKAAASAEWRVYTEHPFILFHARPRGRADRDLQGSHAARN